MMVRLKRLEVKTQRTSDENSYLTDLFEHTLECKCAWNTHNGTFCMYWSTSVCGCTLNLLCMFSVFDQHFAPDWYLDDLYLNTNVWIVMTFVLYINDSWRMNLLQTCTFGCSWRVRSGFFLVYVVFHFENTTWISCSLTSGGPELMDHVKGTVHPKI